MGEHAAQPAALELHDIDMRAVDGLLKTFETLNGISGNRKQIVHRTSALPLAAMVTNEIE
ncbi:hypothetical protein ACSVBT_19850 [Afipia sp. TerB]